MAKNKAVSKNQAVAEVAVRDIAPKGFLPMPAFKNVIELRIWRRQHAKENLDIEALKAEEQRLLLA